MAAAAAILKITKIAIYPQRFDRCLRNLVRWCKMGFLTSLTFKKLKFTNPRCRTAAILKTVKLSCLCNRLTDFWWNLHDDAHSPLTADRPLKFQIFENPRHGKYTTRVDPHLDNSHQVWSWYYHPLPSYSVFVCSYVTWPCDLDLWPFDLEQLSTWRVTWPTLPPSLNTRSTPYAYPFLIYEL